MKIFLSFDKTQVSLKLKPEVNGGLQGGVWASLNMMKTFMMMKVSHCKGVALQRETGITVLSSSSLGVVNIMKPIFLWDHDLKQLIF